MQCHVEGVGLVIDGLKVGYRYRGVDGMNPAPRILLFASEGDQQGDEVRQV